MRIYPAAVKYGEYGEYGEDKPAAQSIGQALKIQRAAKKLAAQKPKGLEIIKKGADKK
jgi:hypothetical protein